VRSLEGTAQAQTGSFIHEAFHGAYDSIHVTTTEEVQDGLNDKVRRGLASRQRADAMFRLFEEDSKEYGTSATDGVNMLSGGHLQWPGPPSYLHKLTLAEMVDTPLWL